MKYKSVKLTLMRVCSLFLLACFFCQSPAFAEVYWWYQGNRYYQSTDGIFGTPVDPSVIPKNVVWTLSNPGEAPVWHRWIGRIPAPAPAGPPAVPPQIRAQQYAQKIAAEKAAADKAAADKVAAERVVAEKEAARKATEERVSASRIAFERNEAFRASTTINAAEAQVESLKAAEAYATQERSIQEQQSARIQAVIDGQVAETRAMVKGMCFSDETPIWVKDDSDVGFRSMPISSIKRGDFAVTSNLEPGKERCEFRQVQEVFSRIVNHLMRLTINGKILRTTDEHPFYVPARKDWIKAQDLTLGDQLETLFGDIITLENIEHEYGEFTVYNFAVDGNQNYYASDVLVHNCNVGVSGVVAALTTSALGLSTLTPMGALAAGAVFLGTYVGNEYIANSFVVKNLPNLGSIFSGNQEDSGGEEKPGAQGSAKFPSAKEIGKSKNKRNY